MVTIKDVARLSGVSLSTVSRVLNGNGYVSETTQKKVMKTINQLNYTPNQIARGLVSRKSNTIGLFIPDIMNPFFPAIARSVEDTAQQMGYSVIFCNTDGNFNKEKKYIQLLTEKYVDGIIIIQQINPSNLHALYEKKIPIVLTDARVTEDLSISTIYTDNKYGGELATYNLIENKYQRIAHIRGPVGTISADDRFEGYKAALTKSKLIYDPTLVQYGDFQIESGFNAMKSLIALSHPPDAVFVANDLMALGALEALRNTNYKVPQDIGVIGFDGISFSEISYPKLCTIQQPFFEIGELAIKTLINSIKNPEKIQHIVLKPKLIIRNTSNRGGK